MSGQQMQTTASADATSINNSNLAVTVDTTASSASPTGSVPSGQNRSRLNYVGKIIKHLFLLFELQLT